MIQHVHSSPGGGAAWKAAAAARDGQLDLCHVLMGSRHALIGSRPFEPMGVRSEDANQSMHDVNPSVHDTNQADHHVQQQQLSMQLLHILRGTYIPTTRGVQSDFVGSAADLFNVLLAV